MARFIINVTAFGLTARCTCGGGKPGCCAHLPNWRWQALLRIQSGLPVSEICQAGWIIILPVSKMRIWIDLDNSPHAQFFPPLIERLEEAGYEVLLTARRFGQVEEIAASHGLHYTVIGRHRTPRLFVTRALATVVRAMRLSLY